MAQAQTKVDAANASFWDEMCGSSLAVQIGADGRDKASIAKFDGAFFDMYPYLDHYINFDDLTGRKVLEIGLGYGTVAQKLASIGNYTGLDIAEGPVNWVNHRIGLHGLRGEAVQGSALDMPFDNGTFDAVVSIGCLHATGDLRKAIGEVHRVLRPGGRAAIMVYNATSYYRWLVHTKATRDYVRAALNGADEPLKVDDKQSGWFDRRIDGSDAPECVLTSKTTLGRLLKDFRNVSIARTNVARHRYIHVIPRNTLNAIVGPLFGLDLYATAIK